MIFSALDAVKSAYDSLIAGALLANAPKPVAKDVRSCVLSTLTQLLGC